jgi:archaellum biogenesis protein FlaJ (TadC family)
MCELLLNPWIVWCAMAVLIFVATQFIKMPIKHFTKKIKNERGRRIANISILLIPFALGVLFDYLYCTYVIYSTYSILVGLGYGSAGISLYGAIERFFKVKIDNPYNTVEGKLVTDLVNDVCADGQVNKADVDKVNSFWQKVQ